MKENRSQEARPDRQPANHKTRPEIRDNLDSRANEEQDDQGENVTHNEKDVHHEGKEKKK